MLPAIVDSHIHLRDPARHRYELLHETGPNGEVFGVAPQPYLSQDYFADADCFTLAGLVHIEAEWDRSDPVGESRWVQGLDQGGVPMIIVGFADLSDRRVDAVLEGHAALPLMRGVRQMLTRVDGNPALCWADREYLDDPVWHANNAKLGYYGLDFDVMCFGHQMEPMARLAARQPATPLHLEHAGLPWDHSIEGREVWRRGMRALAALEHVDMKISGLGIPIKDCTVANIRPYVLETIDIFGPERVSFASNFPSDKRFSDMATIWNAFDEITAAFTPDERDAMFYGNALRLYRFPKSKALPG